MTFSAGETLKRMTDVENNNLTELKVRKEEKKDSSSAHLVSPASPLAFVFYLPQSPLLSRSFPSDSGRCLTAEQAIPDIDHFLKKGVQRKWPIVNRLEMYGITSLLCHPWQICGKIMNKCTIYRPETDVCYHLK